MVYLARSCDEQLPLQVSKKPSTCVRGCKYVYTVKAKTGTSKCIKCTVVREARADREIRNGYIHRPAS